LPRYFEFPTRGYTDRPVSEARAAYDRLARGGDKAMPEPEPAEAERA
jgi:ParB family chromosome partitioning protein